MKTNCIISAEGLEELLNGDKDRCVILDCRFSLSNRDLGFQQYHQGHIPSAYYFHLETDMSGPKRHLGGRHPLPDLTALARKLELCGVDSHSEVIVYDDNLHAYAARAWWLLNYIGLERVRVLNGGLLAWQQINGPVDAKTPVEKSGRVHLQPKWDWAVNYSEVQAISRALCEDCSSASAHLSATWLIDSREHKRYLGVEEPIDPVAGHIPGAVNYPWQEVSDEHGAIRPLEFHLQRWHDIPAKTEPVVYCGSGVTACVNLLSMSLAGRPGRLYPGSWSDWCSRH